MSQLRLTLALTTIAAISFLPQLPLAPLVLLVLSAIATAAITQALIPRVREYMLRKGVYGLDINKRGS